MLRNYLKVAFRSLRKNKVPSAINIVGLSIAIACSIVVYLFLDVYLSFDSFHENGDAIFLVQHVVDDDGTTQAWGATPMPLGPAMEADFPQVERAVRVDRAGGTVRVDGDAFDTLVSFADRGFFESFTFPLAFGTPEALADPNSVILSREAAIRYFGEADPVGQQVTIAVGGGRGTAFTVRGVAEAFPNNAGFSFDVLLSFDQRLALLEERPDDWSASIAGTFVQLRQPSDVENVAASMERYRNQFDAATPTQNIASFRFDNLEDAPWDAYTVRQRLVEAPHPVFIGMMAAIALFMMALACFNYVNISLGAAARRLREIGTRKALGSTKRQLIFQFLAENVLLCTGALIVGLTLAQAVLVPLFNDLFVLQISVSLVENLEMWGFLAGLLVTVAVISGAYPAVYVASFEPTSIFRGDQRLDRKPWYTHAFLTFQFVLAFVAVIVGVLLMFNGRYMASLDWGYSPDRTLVVRLTGEESFDSFRDAARQDRSIEHVAGSRHHVGVSRSSARVQEAGSSDDAFRYAVGPGYFEAAGLRLQSGRVFDERTRSGSASDIVVNESFVEARRWDEPIGQTVRIDSSSYQVIGVVGDFLHTALAAPRPVFFSRADTEDYRYMVVQYTAGADEQALASIRSLWQERVPDASLDYFYQTTVFDQNLQTYDHLTASVGYLAALALLIACMGLFGLSSQNLSRRLKEISVRKVLGASLGRLIVRVNRRFLTLLTVAALIATGGCYAIVRTLLSVLPEYVNHMPLGPTPFVAAVAVVYATAAVAVAGQIHRLADADPAQILRTE